MSADLPTWLIALSTIATLWVIYLQYRYQNRSSRPIILLDHKRYYFFFRQSMYQDPQWYDKLPEPNMSIGEAKERGILHFDVRNIGAAAAIDVEIHHWCDFRSLSTQINGSRDRTNGRFEYEDHHERWYCAVVNSLFPHWQLSEIKTWSTQLMSVGPYHDEYGYHGCVCYYTAIGHWIDTLRGGCEDVEDLIGKRLPTLYLRVLYRDIHGRRYRMYKALTPEITNAYGKDRFGGIEQHQLRDGCAVIYFRYRSITGFEYYFRRGSSTESTNFENWATR